MLKIELLEPIVWPEGKSFAAVKYVVYNDTNHKALIMRSNLYDNGRTTTYVYDFKKNLIVSEVEQYLECSICHLKQMLLSIVEQQDSGSDKEPLEAVLNKITEAMHFNMPAWLKSEWLVARWLDGYMVEAGNAGFDVIDKQGKKYQVKTKELFKENREYGTRGTIEFKTAKSLDFDHLVVVGITEDTKSFVEARMWTKPEVVDRMGSTKSFSISNDTKFKVGKLLKTSRGKGFAGRTTINDVTTRKES